MQFLKSFVYGGGSLQQFVGMDRCFRRDVTVYLLSAFTNFPLAKSLSDPSVWCLLLAVFGQYRKSLLIHSIELLPCQR